MEGENPAGRLRIFIVVLLLLAVGAFVIWKLTRPPSPSEPTLTPLPTETETGRATAELSVTQMAIATPSPSPTFASTRSPTPAPTARATLRPTPTPTFTPLPEPPSAWSIGTSVEKREIIVHRWGDGGVKLLFVGGIHGGYEINSIDLMREAVGYFQASPGLIPAGVTLYIVPSLNPDGEALYLAKGASDDTPVLGRFNGHGVDLNRNFDCAWTAKAFLRDIPVNAGTAAFSEPEVTALLRFVDDQAIDALIFYHSAWPPAGQIAVGACSVANRRSLAFLDEVAGVMGYPTARGTGGGAYPVTGDAVGYFNSMGIVAIEIELPDHETIDWEKNRRGILAALAWAQESLE